ncbi:spore coat protein U domain-containing protein [Sphingomonas sp. RP10(2022)]|uniref:Spore coat protein U domain-containing protein n=1 Tax=Sphingomonas liriopis TaxID=2949094 RepID=A0A9X2HMD3_9SPHN|nr:spore coat protein U domain-containing protein [Sphingomonas liriopis]MCP3733643.1 spore coat protein U domain-containing protein [Sphingomonas liriopis]
MTYRGWVWRMAALAVAGGLAAPVMAAPACAPTAKVTTTAGPYSPAAISAAKVPAVPNSAGLVCDSTLVVLFGSNSVKATISSLNGMKLANGAARIAYIASADPGGTVPLTPGQPIEYMQNNVLNALGLLGGTAGTLPLYVKPTGGAAPAVGRYTDTITITWDWRICKGISALVCIGGYDVPTGVVKSEVTITLDVAPQDMTIALTSATTWDPVNGTTRPLAFPGSKGRTSLTVRNPDLVALDDGSIAIVYKVPAKASVALDGDGSGSATVVGFADGSPASGTTFSAATDVSYSADKVDQVTGTTNWSYAPVAGNRASEAAVTFVRFRPRGAMKAGTSFTLSVPYLVR